MNQVNCMNAMWLLGELPDNSVDMVMTSPPYEDARKPAGDRTRTAWVSWAVAHYLECQRVCKGLVCWVVEGRTKNFQWSATPIALMHSLQQAGVKLRKPPIFFRSGIPGSGGPDWLRNDYEFMVCSSKGKLPWSDNTALGGPPKYKVGGAISHRLPSGKRIKGKQVIVTRTNPGNVIHCKVGRGHMGSNLAHENEAPYPESLCEFMIRSFCRPGGMVLDPFMGSGTTLAVAKKLGRDYLGCDFRQSQVDIALRRLQACVPV